MSETSTKNDSQILSLLTVSEVVTLLKCHESFVYHNWKLLGGKKLSRKMLRFPRTAIENYIKSR